MQDTVRIAQSEYRHLVCKENDFETFFDALFDSATLSIYGDRLYLDDGVLDILLRTFGGYRYFAKLAMLKEQKAQKEEAESDGNV